jgi:hypothetical protein
MESEDPEAAALPPDPRVLSVDLQGRELHTGERSVVPSDQRLLVLSPGVIIRVYVNVVFPKCPPMLLNAEMVYMFFQSDEDRQDGDLIAGEFFSSPKRLTVADGGKVESRIPD